LVIFFDQKGAKIMTRLNKDLIKIVKLTMPFTTNVISAYSRIKSVFTSGDLSREAKIPRSTAKYYIKKMVEMRMISKIPYKKKYQKYSNAIKFSDWLFDLIKLAIKPVEIN
jgi:Fic family protein